MIDRLKTFQDCNESGAWPLLVRISKRLVNSVNERDQEMKTRIGCKSDLWCERKQLWFRNLPKFWDCFVNHCLLQRQQWNKFFLYWLSVLNPMEVLDDSRSVMPFDALGRTRHTMERKKSKEREQSSQIDCFLWNLETEFEQIPNLWILSLTRIEHWNYCSWIRNNS